MESVHDLIIIGSGPAGLAAAIYAQRACLDSIVIEKDMVSGGQVLTTYEVDNYPGLPGINGFDLGSKLREHAEKLGAKFVTDEVQRVELVKFIGDYQSDGVKEKTEVGRDGEVLRGSGEFVRAAQLEMGEDCQERTKNGRSESIRNIKVAVCADGVYRAKAVLIATGAHHRKLGVPGEEKLLGMGVSYCATCDGAFFRNRTVAVVGGGDVALEDAIFLSRLCEKVYLIHRRDELRGAKSLQETALKQENIEVLWDTVVEEIQGEMSVTGLRIKNKKTGKESLLEVQGVFVAVGITPNSQSFDGLVEMDGGYIRAGEDTKTSVPGIFAAGDVRTKQLRQIVTAAADGANGIASVEEYLTRAF